MLLSISTTHTPATDLGYLLAKEAFARLRNAGDGRAEAREDGA